MNDTTVVAVETATETVGVALRSADGVEAEFVLTGRRRHVETLTPALEDLLVSVGLVPADLGLVVVDVGPGLFTGLRVGVAAAKALAQSLGVDMLGATSLDVLTHAAAEVGHRGLVLACVDARRGEVFASVRTVGATETIGAVRVIPGLYSPDSLATTLRDLGGEAVLAVGDGARRYADLLRAVDGVRIAAPGLLFPPPASLLRLALSRHAAGEVPVAPGSLVPLYMREADARINFAQATRT